ncbi:MAG: amidohydrolase family protein [Deltaproteobacteria bacterium]|nr:amidohydrolase family protein [Deltaproteobacteria bacterium]MBW2723180.1 amidohydrolase family protein [Deltaproteobacteria bacterium]
MLDILIKGGTLIDGTGAPARPGDLGIRDGRIVAIGEVSEEAHKTIDAQGRVVSPGFIDVHTHYDAQAFWDGTLSPSPYHGVTTVMAGNCGFSIAPLSAEAGDYLMRMLARVEGMPLESLANGVPWDWTSFGEYLGKLDDKLAVNAGFMVGHSALRRVVMGERAVGHEATEEELAEMERLLGESLSAGGMGFSSTVSATHNDGDGQPVPSRHASREELIALARVVRDHPGTVLEFLPGVGEFTEEQKQLMTDLSLAAQRSLNWNVLAPSGSNPEMAENQLSATDYARERGAEVLALTVPQPMTVRINLYAGFVFDALHGWDDFFRLSIPERIEVLRDPAKRAEMDANAQSEESGIFRFLANWANMTVDQTFSKDTEKYRGRTIGEIAQELGKSDFDTLVEIAIADNLKTYFMPPSSGDDAETWALRGRIWHDDRSLIGASDAGAHLDMIDTFAFSTQVLGPGVREHKVMGIEEAVRQLTSVPAAVYGLVERGQLALGWHADVVVFDPETVGVGETYTRFDLPMDEGRLYADAIGIEHVFVNGVEIIDGQKHTGDLPGTVLRSGRDTETVPIG